MTILITGGLGFIGGHFLRKIKDKNNFDQIIVFDKMVKHLNTDVWQQQKRCKFALFYLSLAPLSRLNI